MRRWLLILLIAPMTGAHPAAQGLVTIVAPAAPGGGWDQTARVLQQVFARVEPGTRVQVENVPGAAGTIGLARFVSAERGNPNALLVTGLVMVSGIVTSRAPVTLAQATPIARLTGEYEAIVVPSGSRWQTMAELVAALRAAPGSVAWGGGSAGGTDDMLVRLIAAAAGVPPGLANYIAFPGGGAALAAVLGGQVTAGVSGYGEFAGQVASGALRVLAISAPARVPQIDAPTLREAGIDVELANWRGLVAPPGLSDAERDRLTARIESVARSAEWKATLERHEWADLLLTGAAFRQFLLAEQHRVEQVLRGLEATDTTAARRWRPTPMTLPVATLFASCVLVALVLRQQRRAWRTDADLRGVSLENAHGGGAKAPRAPVLDGGAEAPPLPSIERGAEQPGGAETPPLPSVDGGVEAPPVPSIEGGVEGPPRHSPDGGAEAAPRRLERSGARPHVFSPGHEGRADLSQAEPTRGARLRRVAPLVATLFVYALAMPGAGFVPASTALFGVAARLLGSRRATRDLLIGAVASTALFVAFTQGLDIDLPADPFTRWLAR